MYLQDNFGGNRLVLLRDVSVRENEGLGNGAFKGRSFGLLSMATGTTQYLAGILGNYF